MNSLVSRFTSFDKLIATTLIKILYWLGIAGIAIGVLGGIIGGFSGGFVPGLIALVVAPIIGLIGLIFWRFVCEIYIVIFGMYDRLGEINQKLTK